MDVLIISTRFALFDSVQYVDEGYMGFGQGEYMYYDSENGRWDDSACELVGSERCVKMDCHLAVRERQLTSSTHVEIKYHRNYFGSLMHLILHRIRTLSFWGTTGNTVSTNSSSNCSPIREVVRGRKTNTISWNTIDRYGPRDAPKVQ